MKNSIKTIDAFFLYLLLFTSNDTILFGTNSFVALTYFSRIIPLVFVAYVFLTNRKKNGTGYGKYLVLLLLLLFVALSFVVNKGEIVTLISRTIAILTGCIVAIRYSFDDFKDLFVKFILFNCIFALFLEALAYAMPTVLMVFPTVYNVSATPFKTCLFSSIMFPTTSRFVRASGVFWEPGAFSICINIALMLMLFGKKKYAIKHYIIMILALLLTFSTTGYIGFLVLFVIFILSKRKTTRKAKIIQRLLAFLVLSLAVLLIFTNDAIYNMVFGKIIDNSSSSSVRFDSFFGGLKLAWQNPLFGVFPTNVSDMISRIAPASGGMLTSNFVYQFASFGLLFGSIFLILNFLFFCKNFEVSLFCKFLLLFFFVLIFFSETFFSFLPFVFAFYGVGKPQKEKQKTILTHYYENCFN